MSTKKIRIAVADDHQICRDGLISMLDPEQYEVVGEANNGITIVELAKQFKKINFKLYGQSNNNIKLKSKNINIFLKV